MDTYDPESVTISVIGNLITGFAAGEFITAEYNEDAFTTVVGADGKVCRVRNANQTATITLTLMQSSPSNDVLSAAANLDRLTGNGAGAFLLKDGRGTTLLSAQNCWVKKPPPAGFGKELGDRAWIIECDKLEGTIGGVA